MAHNGSGIGEEAVSKSSIELQNLKIRTICQMMNIITNNISAALGWLSSIIYISIIIHKENKKDY